MDNKFIVNPTTKEMENSELDLVLAGTENAILMIEVCLWSFSLFHANVCAKFPHQ